jgi:hypothetical protein
VWLDQKGDLEFAPLDLNEVVGELGAVNNAQGGATVHFTLPVGREGG